MLTRWIHKHTFDGQEKDPLFLKNYASNLSTARKYVQIPDGIHCQTCFNSHGYPSHELTPEGSEDFYRLFHVCSCHCAYIEPPRHWAHFDKWDFLKHYFTELGRKFGSLESLLEKNCSIFDERSLKLVKEIDTTKEEKSTIGPVMEKLSYLPEGILEKCKSSYPRILFKLYDENSGFVKGKYLVISTELLFRNCFGNIEEFLKILCRAYSLVQSQYYGISRLAIEGGFWQVCPEFAGLVWRRIDFKNKYPFLKDFLKNKTVFIRNFSLSMGPCYLTGGGYFSYIYNMLGDLVIWYVPNFWSDRDYGYYSELRFRYMMDCHFWFGNEVSKLGCYYDGVKKEECDSDMLDFLRFERAGLHYSYPWYEENVDNIVVFLRNERSKLVCYYDGLTENDCD